MPVSILHDPDEGGAIAAVHAALETAPVAGRRLTLDALPTIRETARRIVETQGSDGMMTGSKATLPRPSRRSRASTGRPRARDATAKRPRSSTAASSRAASRFHPAREDDPRSPRPTDLPCPPARRMHEIRKTDHRARLRQDLGRGRPRLAATGTRREPRSLGVERPHPIRDATFREDDSRLRARNAPANHAILHTLALAVILHHPRKLPQPFPSFADAHPYADPRKPVLHAVTRPAGPRPHPDRNRKHPSRPPNPAGLSLVPDPPKRAPRAPLHAATGPQTSAPLTIADSNASTRAAIKNPIASHQQARDHLGVHPLPTFGSAFIMVPLCRSLIPRVVGVSEPVRKLLSDPDSGICDVAGDYIGIKQAHFTSVRLLSKRSLRSRYFARAARIGAAP